ncbi:Nucleus accumbens-associated protein 1 [Myotis davidii]|uniref:Nucleus accumbens-associated protein 1 n=1 Tax=Myotis davidii TaxID=225400 RepID=L5LLP1_MYODS|nr:Nucleus accumbens-associated protein 1 [Myotis davidii]
MGKPEPAMMGAEHSFETASHAGEAGPSAEASSNPHQALHEAVTLSLLSPTHHLGHELLSVPPQDPQGVLHAPAPRRPRPTPDPNPRGLGEVRALRGLLSRTGSGSTRSAL